MKFIWCYSANYLSVEGTSHGHMDIGCYYPTVLLKLLPRNSTAAKCSQHHQGIHISCPVKHRLPLAVQDDPPDVKMN